MEAQDRLFSRSDSLNAFLKGDACPPAVGVIGGLTPLMHAIGEQPWESQGSQDPSSESSHKRLRVEGGRFCFYIYVMLCFSNSLYIILFFL